jgi:hypothetical protein
VLRLLVDSKALPLNMSGKCPSSGPNSVGALLAWHVLRTSRWRNRQRTILTEDALPVVDDENIATSISWVVE